MLTTCMPIGAKDDPNEFDVFYVNYFPLAVKAIKIQYATIDIETAHELAQETMLCMYRRRDEIGRMKDHERRAYLMAAAKNKAIDHLRKQPRQTPLAEEAAERGYDDTADITDALQVKEDIKRLPAELREVVVLRYYADLTVPQIAKITGVNKNTVNSRLRIARKYLKHWINAKGNRGTQKGPDL